MYNLNALKTSKNNIIQNTIITNLLLQIGDYSNFQKAIYDRTKNTLTIVLKNNKKIVFTSQEAEVVKHYLIGIDANITTFKS